MACGARFSTPLEAAEGTRHAAGRSARTNSRRSRPASAPECRTRTCSGAGIVFTTKIWIYAAAGQQSAFEVIGPVPASARKTVLLTGYLRPRIALECAPARRNARSATSPTSWSQGRGGGRWRTGVRLGSCAPYEKRPAGQASARLFVFGPFLDPVFRPVRVPVWNASNNVDSIHLRTITPKAFIFEMPAGSSMGGIQTQSLRDPVLRQARPASCLVRHKNRAWNSFCGLRGIAGKWIGENADAGFP